MAKLGKAAKRRLIVVGVLLLALVGWLIFNPKSYEPEPVQAEQVEQIENTAIDGEVGEWSAVGVLAKLEVHEKDTSQKYVRKDFYSNWSTYEGCDMRNVILQRDLKDTVLEKCIVMTGVLEDPYTGKTINFVRGSGTSSAVQIDHVVALSNAWGTGAMKLDDEQRHSLSQDPLNLLAVDGPANSKKSDKDAADWLPENVAFQCEYVARQISVKFKYVLWVTEPEKTAMEGVLETCPDEPTVGLESFAEQSSAQ
ncbi:MAG: HNH endonuclease family protein [Candidatus Saccharimonadales bacterium]